MTRNLTLYNAVRRALAEIGAQWRREQEKKKLDEAKKKEGLGLEDVKDQENRSVSE